ncbi:MAG: 4-diphosphocytidyl-2-C-methyl-D-erythritol kinase [Pseudolabrys sp.]|nr:4-diphosphocytidyl-2-C-methyl-D-erythritol kinase [Pseudolabrys sp.]
MSGGLRDTAPAKVNLSLRIVGRRADGYHELESLVAFADIGDALELTPGEAASLCVSGPFAAASGAANDNLILKAVRAAGLPAGAFSLDKRLPVAAGLGGGSSDAAAALRLVARYNGISVDDPRILAAARAAGADVPVCLDRKPRVMRGVGELLSEPVTLPKLPAVLVNPGVAVPTASVFVAFRPEDSTAPPIDEVPIGADALLRWLASRGNDLTAAAIRVAPAVATVLDALSAQPGCRLSRMSGSGATCFGLFESTAAAAAAAETLGGTKRNWWIYQGMLG